MKINEAVRGAWGLYRRNFPQLMLVLLIELVLRLIVLAPLVFLSAPQTAPLALLCVPLFILIVLPARQNAALAMQDMQQGGSCLSLRLISTEHYGQKVARGLRQAGLLLLWGLPFLGATGFAFYIYKGNVDVFTVLRTLISLGGGSSVQGVKIVLLIYAATLLPFFFGCAFHSWNRHAAAIRQDRNVIRGRRCGLVLTWLIGLVTVLPFAAVTAAVGMGYVRGVMEALGNFASGINLPSPDRNIYLIAAAFVLLLLPLIPLKQLLPAAYVSAVSSDVEAPGSGAEAVL